MRCPWVEWEGRYGASNGKSWGTGALEHCPFTVVSRKWGWVRSLLERETISHGVQLWTGDTALSGRPGASRSRYSSRRASLMSRMPAPGADSVASSARPRHTHISLESQHRKPLKQQYIRLMPAALDHSTHSLFRTTFTNTARPPHARISLYKHSNKYSITPLKTYICI